MLENTESLNEPNTSLAASPADVTPITDNEKPIKPTREIAPVGSLADKAGVNAKEDWFLTRVKAPDTSTENLFNIYGADGFTAFKPKEEYWKSAEVQKVFSDTYGSEAKRRFDDAYDNSKKEFANFQLGNYQRSQTGSELLRDNANALRMDVTTRFSNMAGTLKVGEDWTMPTKDYRENFSAVKVKEVDEDGKESYVIKEYTPELLKELEKDPSFGGLAYSDAFYAIDPNEGVNGLYFNAIHDGRVLDEATGALKDVRDDQIVSRWDLDTGPTSVLGMFDVNLDRVFKNNKLEADGVLDYAKILVKSPINMAVNVMDTAVQLTRAVVAGGYGVADKFTDDDLDVRSSETYKWLTTKGVKLKGNTTSMTREALQDGFFFSLEAALTTTADVALQIALAGGLGRAGSGAVAILEKGLSQKALVEAQTRAAEVVVRGTLTAMAVKDSYNEALENGYSTSEASLITGAMGVAMWKATKYASYIFGDYEVKVLRENIKTAMKAEQEGMLKTLFASIKEGSKTAANDKAKYSLSRMQEVVASVFGRATKMLPPSKMLYVARQEGFEEMTEELFQDGVKQVASAYGALINNAKETGKGRYATIFDDGYFKDAVERYLTSGVAGAIGGPMGMVGNKVSLSPITSASSMTDILLDGRKEELLSVLAEMKSEGALGPKALSTEYNEALEAFEPMVEGSGSETLADMVFKQYEHDINVVDTFINHGMFGKAGIRIQEDSEFKEFVENNSMRKDYVKLMGSILEFHSNTGITNSVYKELDAMSEEKLLQNIPEVLKKSYEDLRIRNEEIAAIKESAKAETSATAPEKKTKIKKEKKTKEDFQEDPGEASELSRLKKEKASSSVSDKEVTTMLSNYRKVRAISTGVAAEHYLMQNEIIDNTMLGAKYNRESKYANLGEAPLIDMMIAMRRRSKEDEKIHAYTEQIASELETKIVSISDSSENGVEELIKLTNGKGFSFMTEKALKAISKLYADADFKETSNAFDVKSEYSIFDRDADGKVDEEDMLSRYKEIMLLSSAVENAEILESGIIDYEITPAIVSKYFRELSKNIRKAYIPEWSLDFYNEIEINDSTDDLIDMILEKGSPILKGAINVSGSHLITLKKLSEKAEQLIKAKGFYKEDEFKKEGVNALFKRGSGDVLTGETLVSEGISVVNALEDSGHEGIYTLTDHSTIDDILDQIDVRLEMAKVLGTLTAGGGVGTHYLKMLAKFRKNVLDIIDFKYNRDSDQDTELEEHSYKDYTVTSDFFTDFVYDPILLMEIYSKDESLHTDRDKEVLRNTQVATSLLRPSFIKIEALSKYISGEGDQFVPEVDPLDLLASDLALDEDLLFNYLNDTKFAANFLDAKDFLNSNSKLLFVPAIVFGITEEQGMIPLYVGGVTELIIAKWLFNKTRDVIVKVADKTAVLPYIQAKNNDNEFTLRTYVELIESDDISGLKKIISDELPDVYLALNQDLKNLSFNEMGALNIKIENILYRIYNNTGLAVPIEEAELLALKEDLQAHVYDINDKLSPKISNNAHIKVGAEMSKKLSILIGALTTDFTPFYSKFKGIIENMSEYDDITVAAQEHAAKYSGAYIYSESFKEMADDMSRKRLMYQTKQGAISGVFVAGVAGSGKSSSVIKLGLKIATEILADNGQTNNAVLPVSIFKSQIDIVSKSVGDLSKGLKGMSVNELHKTLEDAVNGRDEKALDILSNVGIIVIDEATYVKAIHVKEGDVVQLDRINELITLYNDTENITGNKISLLLLGDPRQSGASEHHEGVLYETALEIRRSHPLAYMDFSFRSRNNYLTDSISAITTTIEKSKGNMTGSASFLKLEAGTKYGTTEGKYYGINMVDAADKSSSTEFFKVLNDDVLVSNVEKNIIKAIAANESRPEGSKEIKFQVLIAPYDILNYTSNPSKLKALSEVEAYSKYFKVVEADKVGGSEANYVIGEIGEPKEGGAGDGAYISSLGKTLNTLATRAFDYAVIVNRNASIIIPADSATKLQADGNVNIPDASLDGSAKKKLKANYLEIFKDIQAQAPLAPTGSAGSAVLIGPTVPLPGTVFTLPVDETEEDFNRLLELTNDPTSLLNIKGGVAEFKDLDEDAVENIIKYLNVVNLLLTDTDAEATDLIETLDELSKKVKADTTSKRFNELIDLQLFALQIRNTTAPMLSNALLYSVHTAIDALTVIQEDVDVLDSLIGHGLIVSNLIDKISETIQDPTLESTYSNLLSESLIEPVTQRYAELFEDFLQDVVVDLFGKDIDKYTISDIQLEAIKSISGQMIKAKAAIINHKKAKKPTDVNVDDIATVLTDFARWADSLNDQIEALIKQLEPDNTSTTITLPDKYLKLYTLGHTASSITRAFYDEAVMVKAKKDAIKNKSTYTADVSEMTKLKRALGIDDTVVGVVDLYNAIQNVEKVFLYSLDNLSVTSEEDNVTITNIISIQNLWNKLYKGHKSTFSEEELFGQGFIYRNLEAKETLDDYIKNANSNQGMYTVGVTEHNINFGAKARNPATPNIIQEVLTQKKAQALFNYDKEPNSTMKSSKVPNKVILRVIRAPERPSNRGGRFKEELDILVMTPVGNTNYVISQLHSEEKTDPVIYQMREDLLALINTNPIGLFKANGRDILDLEISGDIKEFLFTRPGGVVTEEDIIARNTASAKAAEQGKESVPIEFLIEPSRDVNGKYKSISLATLKENLAVSKTIRAMTHKPTVASGVTVRNLLGELFVLYSGNKSASLDTPGIKDSLSKGLGLNTSNRIQNNAENNISSQLGVMRLSLKAPLDILGEVMKKNSDISMGATTSYFSVALQSHFIDFADKNFKRNAVIEVAINETFELTQEFKDFMASESTVVGEVVEYPIKGAIRKFVVTEEHKLMAKGTPAGGMFMGNFGASKEHEVIFNDDAANVIEEMRKGLETHYSAKPPEYREKIEKTLDLMKKEHKKTLDEFAWAFIRNKAMTDMPSKTRKYDIIYPSDTGGYIFNINEYLRYSEPSVLVKLTELSDLAQYTLKPNITHGKTVYSGTINSIFGEEALAPFLLTPVLGVKVPSFEISKTGASFIRSAIRDLKNKKLESSRAVYTEEQTDSLISFQDLNALPGDDRDNKILPLGSVAIAKMLEDITTMEDLFKGKSVYDDDMVILAKAKINIIAMQSKLMSWGGLEFETYLPDYALSNKDSKVRKALSAVLLDFKGSEEAKKRLLDAISMLNEESEENIVDEIIEWSESEDDIDTVNFLKGCNFNS